MKDNWLRFFWEVFEITVFVWAIIQFQQISCNLERPQVFSSTVNLDQAAL